jgi:5-methylcytosine-specific restriction endonuclease McrA
MKRTKTFSRNTNNKKFKNKKSYRAVTQKLYQSKQWREYTFKFLAKNPKCFTCNQKSNVTDHIRAHKNNMDLFWDEKNYIPLCHNCHNYITGNFDMHNPQKLVEKMKWIKSMRQKNDLYFSVKVVRIKNDQN